LDPGERCTCQEEKKRNERAIREQVRQIQKTNPIFIADLKNAGLEGAITDERN
jgi:hypothetical protein